MEAREKRPWWRKKTTYGLIGGSIATILLAFPATTVLATAGPLIVTTAVAGKIIGGLSAVWASYSIADRAGKKNEE